MAAQQFGRGFADPFRVFAARIAAMVEEELQERQVIVAEVTKKTGGMLRG